MRMKAMFTPPFLVDIIEKTAGFVAKNGREFEAKIQENERHNQKFAFMNPNDPYHLYYQRRLHELLENGPEAILKAISEARAPESSLAGIPEAVATVLPKTSALMQQTVELEKLEFLLELPEMSALDLDVMKLTAQFAAKNGRHFLLLLSQKESRNPQFDFLKPHHNLHVLFQSLIRQFELVLCPSPELLARIERLEKDSSSHFALVKSRARIEKTERKRLAELQTAADEERSAFARIDWHDWIIAETISFGPEDQDKSLPPPLSFEMLKTLPLTQRLEMWTGKREAATEPASETFELLESSLEQEPGRNANPQEEPVLLPSKRTSEVIMGAALGSAPIKVRTDYVPRAAAVGPIAAAANETEPTQICSICKVAVPVSQIEEHIRIELLDPKWREQRLAAMAKHRDSNILQTGSDVSRNLAAMARMRSDNFVSASAANTDIVIQRGPTRPVWDGRPETVAQIHRAASIMARPLIQQEMASLQQAGDLSLDPSRGIGPRLSHPQPPLPGPFPFAPYPPGQFYPSPQWPPGAMAPYGNMPAAPPPFYPPNQQPPYPPSPSPQQQ